MQHVGKFFIPPSSNSLLGTLIRSHNISKFFPKTHADNYNSSLVQSLACEVSVFARWWHTRDWYLHFNSCNSTASTVTTASHNNNNNNINNNQSHSSLNCFYCNCSLDGSSTLIYAEQKIKWTRFSFKTIWGKNWSLRVITYYYYFFSRFHFIVLQRQFVDALPVRNCHLANRDNWTRYGSNIIIR